MTRLSSVVGLVALLLVVGCSSSAVDPSGSVRQENGGPLASVAVGEPFSLHVGESVLVRGPDIRVTFVSVPEDSRCPQAVQCVWEGNARLLVVLAQSGASTSASVNTTLEPRTATFAGHTLQLVELRPQKGAQEPLSQSEYLARFRLVRTP